VKYPNIPNVMMYLKKKGGFFMDNSSRDHISNVMMYLKKKGGFFMDNSSRDHISNTLTYMIMSAL